MDIINKIKEILLSQEMDDTTKIYNVTKMLETPEYSELPDLQGGDKIMKRDISKLTHPKVVVVNASDYPKTYYMKHMEKGVAYYSNMNKMLMLDDGCLKRMANSLCNKPIYIEHKDSEEDTVDKLEKNMHGVVSDSFYNELDGWYWAKVVVFTDEANNLIKNGWKISNSYTVNDYCDEGGMYHGMKYDIKIKNATYDHIAIVDNPRYNDVLILNPNEYKEYNENLKQENLKYLNSLNDKKPKKGFNAMLKLWKKTKIENSEDIADAFVEVNEKDIPLNDLISCWNSREEEKKEEKKIFNGEFVKIGDKDIKLDDLIQCYNEYLESKKEKIENSINEESQEKQEQEKENEHFENIQNAILDGQKELLNSNSEYETLSEKLERGKNY